MHHYYVFFRIFFSLFHPILRSFQPTFCASFFLAIYLACVFSVMLSYYLLTNIKSYIDEAAATAAVVSLHLLYLFLFQVSLHIEFITVR